MSSLSSLVEELELFQETLNQIYTFNYITTAVFVILLYDTVLTFSKEVKFIWSKPIAFSKVLYIIARYYGLLSSGIVFFMTVLPARSLNSCRIYLKWYASAGPQINEVVVNLVLLLRIYALYGRNKRLLYLIVPIFLAESGLVIYGGAASGVQDNRNLQAMPAISDISSLPSCFFYFKAPPSYRITLAAWIPAGIQAATFFALSVYKVYEKTTITHREFWSLSEGLKIPELMRVIFLDGVIFYFANTAVIVISVTALFLEHNCFSGLSALIEILIYSLCGCHFILHLYEIGNPQQTSATGPDLVFRTQIFAAPTELELSDNISSTPTPARQTSES